MCIKPINSITQRQSITKNKNNDLTAYKAYLDNYSGSDR